MNNETVTTEAITFFGQTAPVLWILVIGISILLAGVARLILKFISSRIAIIAEKTVSKVDDIVVACLCNTKGWALFFWIGTPLAHFVGKDPSVDRTLSRITIIVTAIQVVIWGYCAILGWQRNYIAARIEKDASSASAMNLLVTSVKGLFVIAVFLICLSNLGIDIGALVAGLGVGGIAVALAAQNILGDLFGSLSIVLDKPFLVGDYIVVGNDQGTVENIGIKTTRVRSLTGEELIFSNKDLLESRIKNFKRMRERRVAFTFSVPYGTPLEKVRAIPGWVRAYLNEEPLLRFERSHLATLGKTSLDFETIFWVTDPDYNKYMDLQQALYLKLVQRFAAENIEFALPIQIIQLEKPSEPLPMASTAPF